MTTIAIHESKALYAALEDPEAIKQGPVFLEKDGQPTAVLLSMEEYRKLTGTAKREDRVEKDLAPIISEKEAYQRMLPELLKEHRGKWVAIHQGQVVASSADKESVLQEIAEKRYRLVYLQQVQDEPRTADIPHLELLDQRKLATWREEQLRLTQADHDAFLRLLPDLLKDHRDEWVAIHQGQVVTFGREFGELIEKMHEDGYQDFYVQKIQESLRVIELPLEIISRA